MGRGSIVVSSALILSGLFMLLEQLGWGWLGPVWALVLLVAGGGLLLGQARGLEHDHKLFAGTLLLLLGVFFLVQGADRLQLERHWPFFVLAPGLALAVVWAFGKAGREARMPALVLLGLALFNYLLAWGVFGFLLDLVVGLVVLLVKVAVPLGLIALGAWLLLRGQGDGDDDRGEADPDLPEKVEPAAAASGAGAAATYPNDADDGDDDAAGSDSDDWGDAPAVPGGPAEEEGDDEEDVEDADWDDAQDEDEDAEDEDAEDAWDDTEDEDFELVDEDEDDEDEPRRG